ncbi:hypothetical protein C802_01565 [Phocaeicola sartorii]|jgi:hypothetical protein|uniref:Uncharacterized protein n=1 Tax=Phocaeicola sartorii TaxID=671267 RepID=R9IA78_9BACT|nr:hypothetical protein C802_01565 [Phocaeicola sartorii]
MGITFLFLLLQLFILIDINMMEKLKFMRKIMADYSSSTNWKS